MWSANSLISTIHSVDNTHFIQGVLSHYYNMAGWMDGWMDSWLANVLMIYDGDGVFSDELMEGILLDFCR